MGRAGQASLPPPALSCLSPISHSSETPQALQSDDTCSGGPGPPNSGHLAFLREAFLFQLQPSSRHLRFPTGHPQGPGVRSPLLPASPALARPPFSSPPHPDFLPGSWGCEESSAPGSGWRVKWGTGRTGTAGVQLRSASILSAPARPASPSWADEVSKGLVLSWCGRTDLARCRLYAGLGTGLRTHSLAWNVWPSFWGLSGATWLC